MKTPATAPVFLKNELDEVAAIALVDEGVALPGTYVTLVITTVPLVNVTGTAVRVGEVDVVGLVVALVVKAELLVGVDEVLDKVELLVCDEDGVEVVLGVVDVEVVEGLVLVVVGVLDVAEVVAAVAEEAEGVGVVVSGGIVTGADIAVSLNLNEWTFNEQRSELPQFWNQGITPVNKIKL